MHKHKYNLSGVGQGAPGGMHGLSCLGPGRLDIVSRAECVVGASNMVSVPVTAHGLSWLEESTCPCSLGAAQAELRAGAKRRPGPAALARSTGRWALTQCTHLAPGGRDGAQAPREEHMGDHLGNGSGPTGHSCLSSCCQCCQRLAHPSLTQHPAGPWTSTRQTSPARSSPRRWNAFPLPADRRWSSIPKRR